MLLRPQAEEGSDGFAGVTGVVQSSLIVDLPHQFLSAGVQEVMAALNAVLRVLLRTRRVAVLASRLWLALPNSMPADAGENDSFQESDPGFTNTS